MCFSGEPAVGRNTILGGVQKLHERWKDRMDRAVLTISQDESPAIAASIIKENGYSFPVICECGRFREIRSRRRLPAGVSSRPARASFATATWGRPDP